MHNVRTLAGSISREFLTAKSMTWEKFNKDGGYIHLTEEQKLEFWNATHEPIPVQVKNPSHTIKLDSVVRGNP